MNKLYILMLLVFTVHCAGAQTNYQQFTLGGGSGLAKAYTGATVPNSKPAFYLAATYYPFPVFNIELESQFGSLSGSALPGNKNLKTFSSTYKAGVFDANLYLGVFYRQGNGGFFDFIRNFYGGVGYGVIQSNINNVQLNQSNSPNIVENTLRLVPFKAGYEFDLLRNDFDEPLLKVMVSARFNYVMGKGLDGYYDQYANSTSFYTYYAIGLKYTFVIRRPFGKAYEKMD